jgi:hypothetical protein
MAPYGTSFPTSNRLSRSSVQQKNPNDANLAKFTKVQRIFNRENMNRPLGEYQKNMIDGVLKKYGKYTVKRPIDKQTIRCLNSLVKRGLVTFDAETETYRLKPILQVSDTPEEARG